MVWTQLNRFGAAARATSVPFSGGTKPPIALKAHPEIPTHNPVPLGFGDNRGQPDHK